MTKRRTRWIALTILVAGSLTLGTVRAKPLAVPTGSQLHLLATYPLTVSEPSDLTIDETGTKLWTVGDKPSRVHQIALDGTTVKTLRFVGEDLEGIAYDRSDHTLWVAEENRRELVHLDLEGNVLSRHALDLTGEKNSGLEGLCLDDRGRMFAVNEKRPGLFLELDSTRAIAKQRQVDFAKDFSAISYDGKRRAFWILSDQSQSLYLWSPAAGVTRQYSLPYRKAEGVAVDQAAKRIYIVSDSENKLFVYRLEK